MSDEDRANGRALVRELGVALLFALACAPIGVAIGVLL